MGSLIRDTIKKFIAAHEQSEDSGWKEPLVAYARADDPLFATLKDVASPTHAVPQDFLAEARTVITYSLPFIEKVVESNKTGRFSSRA